MSNISEIDGSIRQCEDNERISCWIARVSAIGRNAGIAIMSASAFTDIVVDGQPSAVGAVGIGLGFLYTTLGDAGAQRFNQAAKANALEIVDLEEERRAAVQECTRLTSLRIQQREMRVWAQASRRNKQINDGVRKGKISIIDAQWMYDPRGLRIA